MAEYIDAALLRKMFLAGAMNLEAKKAWINELNVFPVPDGDTGTNMTLTLMSAVREVEKLDKNVSLEAICKQIATGTLRGARGNSGVIMSQLCRGFAKVAGEHSKIGKNEIGEAFNYAVTTAYKAVMKPKEGTILTVAKAAAQKASELATSEVSLQEYMEEINQYAEFILGKTPDMLPVLKEAGVVDSGGQGLVEFLKGAYDGFMGREIKYEPKNEEAGKLPVRTTIDSSDIATADIKFGYCTEFIIKTENEFTDADEAALKEFLNSIGDSIVVVSMDDIVKVHVHTNHPGQAFEKGLTYGQLSSMKVDNLWEEHNEKVILEADRAAAALKEEKATPAMPHKQFGTVTICVGDGLAEIYNELGVDKIISGGQTMNPSTEDILAAVNGLNVDTVFIFPNNNNIIMAARQAQELCEDRDVRIIPTRTVIEGISAMISFDPAADADSNEALMNEAINAVETAEITYAVRDTELYGKKINNGDYMGIGEGSILAVGSDLKRTTLETIRAMMTDDSSMITIYYGEDAKEEDALTIADAIKAEAPQIETDVVNGGQPVYYYFVSVE